jgi:pimeloyl-ACP methyl ester carboxylesterase
MMIGSPSMQTVFWCHIDITMLWLMTHVWGQVNVPLLCLNAEDDPIIPATALPHEDAQAAPNVVLAVTALGGHVAHFEVCLLVPVIMIQGTACA